METLKFYLEQYERLFNNKTFRINLSNGVSFHITFEINRFAHLLGIQYCAESTHEKEYIGFRAIENIRNETITFEKLEITNAKMFRKFVIKKVEAFETFCSLFPDAKHLFEAIIFNAKRVVEIKDRDLEKARLIIQDKQNPLIRFVFMFGEDSEEKPLFPLSFRKEVTSTVDYLDLQTKIDIESITVEK